MAECLVVATADRKIAECSVVATANGVGGVITESFSVVDAMELLIAHNCSLSPKYEHMQNRSNLFECEEK